MCFLRNLRPSSLLHISIASKFPLVRSLDLLAIIVSLTVGKSRSSLADSATES